MKKKIVLVAAIMLFAAPVFAGSDTTDSLMPGACPLAFSSQHEPEVDFGGLPGRRPTLVGLILGGVAGNLAGTIGLFMLGNQFPSPGDEIIATAAVAGGFVGLIGGSALGVTLAGNTRYWRGNFGSALLGSTLGLLSAFLVTAAIGNDYPQLGLLSMAVLPPVGAAILFHSTLDRRFSMDQGALFSFSGGRLRMGVPDIQLRPLFVPGSDARPGLQFQVRVLSVEL